MSVFHCGMPPSVPPELGEQRKFGGHAKCPQLQNRVGAYMCSKSLGLSLSSANLTIRFLRHMVHTFGVIM